jgi:hypothetical protein
MRVFTIAAAALLFGLGDPAWAADEVDNELSLQRLDEAKALLEQSIDRVGAAGNTAPDVASHLTRAEKLLRQAHEEMRLATQSLEEKVVTQ